MRRSLKLPCEAWSLGAQITQNSTAEFRRTSAPEGPPVFPEWLRLVSRHGIIGKQVHDARLVAQLNVHGVSHLLTFIRGSAAAAPCGHRRPANLPAADAAPVTIPIGGTPVPVPHRAYCPHCKTWIREDETAVRTVGGAFEHAAC